MRSWQYDEFRHCGVDYSQVEQAEAYDEQHQQFRDYGKEFRGMLEFLDLRDPTDKTVIDLGCGTGATALLAAAMFKTVYAVDVSHAMLERARAKADRNTRNITFVKAGFLTYDHGGEAADLVITKAAFHHLPDFWKQIALLRMNGMMKTGGQLYIHDVVFQFDPRHYAGKIDAWIARFAAVAGGKFTAEVETHIRDEYSTFGWILEKMIANAGFIVEKVTSDDGFVTEYACRKVADVGLGETA
ncbi:class I SAM-dependent methyltransferase [Geotalea uraniireducens]|uniref:Class I SAM-dependent methyltransferase n=1 Tax=Geotalea uraniireducens TaxID=351604 RepID=A0ABM8ENH5_9BACT|nr:class I SAM-dependent methyltransferase [Geotalea uraniireducens]BDV43991.1 class I SAM-dependent methyltransferase [Geotalea uraniireducens]